MIAIPRLGSSAIPAGHVLGSKLDSIPFSPYHLLVILVLGLVGLVDGYDLAMTGSLLVLAKEPLHLTPGEIRVLAVASTLMICVGGFIASAISDHWTRRTIMLIGVATANLFTLLIPLVQSGEQLIIVRLLTGPAVVLLTKRGDRLQVVQHGRIDAGGELVDIGMQWMAEHEGARRTPRVSSFRSQ